MLFGMLAGFILLMLVAVGGLYLVVQPPLLSDDSQTANQTESQQIAQLPSPTAASTVAPRSQPAENTEAVLGSTTTTEQAQPINTPQNTVGFDRAKLYLLINAHRKEAGLSPLQVHSALEQSASRKLQDMIDKQYWRHEDPSGTINWQLFKQSGYQYAIAGENLSFGNNTPWSVFDNWLKSSQHNEQLLKSDYQDMGLATDCGSYQVEGEVRCIVVLHLGKLQI